MDQEKKQALSAITWHFEKLYHQAFLFKIISPLLIAYITYHLYLYLQISQGDTDGIHIIQKTLGATSYILLAFWLLRLSFSVWTNRVEIKKKTEKKEEKQVQKRIFPFPEWQDRPYLYFLMGNALLCLIVLMSQIEVLTTIHLVLLAASLFFRFLAVLLNDYSTHIRYHLSYFYPSILSIVILAFVIAKQEQFGDFFLELARSPLNFIAFSLIFGVSIITVWFAPSYLFFTDHFQLDQERKRSISDRFGIWHKGFIFLLSITTYISRLIPSAFHFIFRYFARNSTESDLMNLLWKHKNEINSYTFYKRESKGFTIARQLLGISYVATLASLAGNVWLKSFGLEWLAMHSAILLLSLLAPVAVNYFYFYTFNQKREGDLQRFRKLLQNSWIGITLIFIILTLSLIILTTLNKVNYHEDRLFLALFLFILTTIFTSLPLICYGYSFQRLGYLLSSQGVSGLEPVKKYARFFTAIILSANASVAGLSLIFLIFMLFVPFEKVYLFISETNTINIYILLVNGLIAGITLIDRYGRVRAKVQNIFFPKPGRLSTSARTWAAILILALPTLIFLGGRGNNYHVVPYHQEAPTSFSLADYTQNFTTNLQAQTDTTQPIILIAADGGGLKAASWTMLNLYHLDSMGLYDNQVFLMAGASGGSLGQGLYTYMKAQGLSLPQIKKIILRLSDMNFVSGDLTGVMTRWPYNTIPDLNNWPERTQDRMEAMTEIYFNTIQREIGGEVGPGNPWSYATLRKRPYATVWNNKEVPHLPVFITNSARAEDGVKAWTHPFTVDSFISAGAVDLSIYHDKSLKRTSYISYPDALFLTNRFPIMSPAAKIKGKGHFIDAGAVDNSGLETLIQFMAKMKALKEEGDSTFQQFFDLAAKRRIKVLSIRHSRGRFIDELFTEKVEGALENTNRKSELSAFFGAVVSAGIYGKPKVIDEIAAKGEAGELFHIDQLLEINLPFRLTPKQVENHFFRKINPDTFKDIKMDIRKINSEIEQTWGSPRIVEPALGRLLSKPSQDYMRQMIHYPRVADKYKDL